jgi:hypothetical protein
MQRRERMYYQGDVLEECHTGRIYVAKCTLQNGLELLPGRRHPKFGYFVQDHNPVPVRVSSHPTGFRKIGVAPSFFPGAMALK